MRLEAFGDHASDGFGSITPDFGALAIQVAQCFKRRPVAAMPCATNRSHFLTCALAHSTQASTLQRLPSVDLEQPAATILRQPEHLAR